MRFVNDGHRPRMSEWLVSIPPEGFVDKYAFRHRAGIVQLRERQVLLLRRRVVSTCRCKIPRGQLRNRGSEGIEEKPVEIETMSFLGLIRAVHAIGIQLARANPLNPDVPHVTSAVARGIQINHPGGRGIFGMIKQLQPNAAGVSAEERKVHSFATCIGSQRQWHTNSNIGSFRNFCEIIM